MEWLPEDLVLRLAEAAGSLGRLAVEGRRCCRVRSSLARCRRCLEVCPSRGIVFEGDRLRLTRCLECGLCAAVCPTEALRLQEPGEPELLGRVRDAVAEEGGAMIACERRARHRREKAALRVPCLGALSLELLLALRFWEGKIAYLPAESGCHGCPVKEGYRLFERRRARLAACGPPPAAVEAAAGVSRREALAAAWTGLRRLLWNAAVSPVLPVPGNGAVRSRPTARKSLYLAAGGPLLLPDLYPVPAGSGRCGFCGACARLCPTDALFLAEDGPEVRLVLDASACVSCGLCAEVCLGDNLEPRPGGVGDAAGEVVLERGRRTACRRCGEGVSLADTGALCPDCAGRNGFLAAMAAR